MTNFIKQTMLVALLLITATGTTLSAAAPLPFEKPDKKIATRSGISNRSVSAFLAGRIDALRRHLIALKDSIVPLPIVTMLSAQESETEATVAHLNIDTLAAIATVRAK